MNWYDVFPKVVPADEVSEVRIRPRYGHCQILDASTVTVWYYAFSGQYPDRTEGYAWDKTRYAVPSDCWRVENGELVVTLKFCAEQQHRIEFEFTRKYSDFYAERKVHGSAAVYSLQKDLYKLQPFKGDFHIHSCISDGQCDPRYAAARFREAGYDFIAISDHKQYQPSIDAVNYWKEVKSPDFMLFPGEEVHLEGNPVHIINFGGSGSVNELSRANLEKYKQEVEKIAAGIPESERIPGADYFSVAASEWAFDRIRERGGLAVFCHPYWHYGANVLSEAVVEAIIKRGKFDAFELLGGVSLFETDMNNFMVNRWMEMLRHGQNFPVVGVSDVHGIDAFIHPDAYESFTDNHDANLFQWQYTIVFAEECTSESLIGNIKKHHSVAVCNIKNETPKLYGDFRLVKYANFLIKDYFPVTRSLCAPEGLLMQSYLAGDEQAKAGLQNIAGRVAAFRNRSFPGK